MAYPEPSLNDHEAPWNMDEVEDEEGEVHWQCSCTSCVASRRRRNREDD